ncbi:hypothetical protein GM418_30820 [Maribellus comscasis]|uniref:Uncharacterized protein n=1 Tax=Maribellus comscasis TaxID=2681766 RepID=A0A6I6JZ72_9BACT|nr:hypothetical protein [Maribellus comscasis]QGY47891.1 hypothetical protein GM418_30820 [Maribellus comscasis]
MNTVWSISDGVKRPAYILDTDVLLPRKKHIEFCEGDVQRWSDNAKTFQMFQIIPFLSFELIFSKNWMGTEYSSIYLLNRERDNVQRFNTTYIYDDLVSNQKLSDIIFSNSTKYLAVEIQPYKLLNQIHQGHQESSKTWLRQIEEVNENDNVILALIKIK